MWFPHLDKNLFLKIEGRSCGFNYCFSILNTQLFFKIELDVFSSQFIYRISDSLESLGIINRSIFSVPVIFVAAAHSVYIARGTRSWLPHDTIIVISSPDRSNNQKIPHCLKKSSVLNFFLLNQEIQINGGVMLQDLSPRF